MTLNSQTNAFPPITIPDRGWTQNLPAVMDYQIPTAGFVSGFRLGIPLNTGGTAVAASLTPNLSGQGVMVQGDSVLEFRTDVLGAAPVSVTGRNIYYGLTGLYYAGSDNLPLSSRDVLVGQVTTNGTTIISIAQPQAYGAGRFGIRGEINLGLVTDGADQTLFTWTPPTIYQWMRCTYAHSRVAIAAAAGNTSGDDNLLKVQFGSASAVTLATIAATNLVTAGTMATFGFADSDLAVGLTSGTVKLLYNQTDTSTALDTGVIAYSALFEGF